MKSFLILLALLLAGNAFTQSLSLDQKFNAVGKAAIRTGDGTCSAMAIQQDGKIIVGGMGGVNINNSGFCLARFNVNGSVDTTFGNHGMTIIYNNGNIQSIVILPDGKILAAGFLGNIMLAQYLPNGILDSSFGVNGVSKPLFKAMKYTYSYALKLQNDGKIVMTGNSNGVSVLTARLLSNGSFDSSFAGIGYAVLSSATIGFDAAIQPDGKIIIAGQGLNYSTCFVARYLSNGTLDPSFGNAGIVKTDITDMYEFISSIALQNDGKIIAVGRYDYNNQYNTNFKTALIKYNIDGSLDNSFGTNAISKFQFSDASADPRKVIIQNDGKIVVAGDYTNTFTFHKPTLTRFNNNGIIDETFGNAGTILTNTFGDSLTCRTAAMQADGKIVISGYQMVKLDTSVLYYTDSFVVVRYETSSILPVALLNFTGVKQQQSAVLNWQTTNETNNGYFSLERSASNAFNEIAKIKSSIKNNYSYIDNQPLNGKNYYRLKQVDKDGKLTYSKIVSVVFDESNKYVIFPNPVNNVINIKGLDANKKYQFTINDAKGSVIKQTTSGNTSSYTWNVQNISNGFYYLNITTGNTTTTLKFVKQ